MGYANETGYVPNDIATIMHSVMLNINTQFGTDYTDDTFAGTNFYKYFYALVQRLQENEVKTSEIFLNLQGYFDQINARISRPVVTNPGIIEKLASLGYVASVKQMIDADAGKISICIDADDGTAATGNITITSYANLLVTTADTVGVAGTTFTAQSGSATPGSATFQAATSNDLTAASLAAQINAHATANTHVRAKALGSVVNITAIHGGVAGNALALAYTDNGGGNIGATKSGTTLTGGVDNADYDDIKHDLCLLISQITVGGAVTQGDQVETITLSNGQAFDFKFFLPTKTPVWLRLTTTLSENNQVLIADPDDDKQRLLDNIAAKYSLGKNFEPQRYYTVVDAPWASTVLLEWTDDVTNGELDPIPTWHSEVFEATFVDLFEVALERITLVEE